MRVLSAVIVFAFAVAGVGAASAADLPADGLGTYSTRSSGVGQRIGTMLVYDYQPGVIVRAYWQAPWRNRHYFPTTGTKPEIGRDEDLSAPSSPSEPPETFYRSWTTSSAFAREVPGTDGAPPPAHRSPPANPCALEVIAMTRPSCKILLLTAIAAALPAAAQAQYYGQPAPAPLYPYAPQGDQPYAVEVAPNTYVIQRGAPVRPYPYVNSRNSGRGIVNRTAAPVPGKFDRPHKPVDHSLVDELRQRHKSKDTKDTVINTTKIVRDKPVVIETKRIVDDPPRIITRRHVVEDDAAPAVPVETEKPASRDDNKKRVIRADAEVTILGPDRMSIRLFRKGQGSKANAQAD